MAKDLQTRIAAAAARLLVRAPGRIVLVLLALAVGSGLAATGLTINTNQLELIDQELREVKEVKRLVDMVGGAGHLLIPLRGDDPDALKKVADDLAAMLEADDENIRTVTHKLDVSFVRDRAALFMKTEDLLELKRRVEEKLADLRKRANPFFFEIRPTPPVELKVDDIVDKYMRVGKVSIADDYNISDDRKMVLMVVKPMWDSNELAQTGELIELLRARIADYSKDNPHGVTVAEDYSREVEDPKRVEYGFTGSYKLQYDESYEIKNSLVPVSGIALAGVLLVLLLFLGRRVGSVVLVFSGLLLGVLVSFGFAELAVGELNMITSMLGGILMGLGIDFGIHLVYRIREELGDGRTLPEAVTEAVTHQGPASFVSALGTGVAFFSLLFSDFRGFSQFGLLAGAGVFLIGLTIYAWVPGTLLLLDRRWPGLGEKLIGRMVVGGPGEAGQPQKRIPRPGLILAVAGLFAVGLAAFAPTVVFDYNTRSLTVEGRPSMALNDEIGDRFTLSSDPVAIYTKTVDEAEKVFHALTSDRDRFDTIDQVVSMFSFIPPADQQARNAAILKDWKKELESVDPAILPEEHREKWGLAMTLLSAEPYGFEELPDRDVGRFRHLPSTRPENHGYLTFVYPGVDMWEGESVLRFADQVDTINTEDGEYHAAGLGILYAVLARIVLQDGQMAIGLTAALLLLILLVDLRSPKAALVGLLPLVIGVLMMLGAMALTGASLNFMNIVVFPIVLGYGVSHGVYLMHRFNEGTSPRNALRSVGTAVACSTLTTLAGWAALLAAAHRGLQTMGILACIGMAATLVVSFTIMPAVLQLMHDARVRKGKDHARKEDGTRQEAA